MGRVRGLGVGESPGEMVSVTGARTCAAVVSSVVGQRSHWELLLLMMLLWLLRMLSDSDLMELAVLS